MIEKDKNGIRAATLDGLINDFADPEKPASVMIKSKFLADAQRLHFKQFSDKMKSF